MTKFKVGQVWLSRCDAEWEIVSVNITKAPYPVMARKKKSGSLATFTANGYLYEQEFESVCDLITLIKDTEETVSKLTPEPIPGHYYRTRDGEKILYIGRDLGKHYLYQRMDLNYSLFSRPFNCFYESAGEQPNDIVAPWTDPLPAIEIKRWALVRRKGEFEDEVRGTFILSLDSKEEAESVLNSRLDAENYEIVELTGTLPAREGV
jgi:hypothetical protein